MAVRQVSGRTSVQYHFSSPFSSKRLWFVDTVLCPSLPTETLILKWLSSLPILMQASFWWWQCSDRYIISLSPHLHTPFSLSLINFMVSVDVKYHVYLLTVRIQYNQHFCESHFLASTDTFYCRSSWQHVYFVIQALFKQLLICTSNTASSIKLMNKEAWGSGDQPLNCICIPFW